MTGSSNVELVRSIYADWERGDFSHVEWADPEIDFVVTDGPAPGSRKGVAGMAEGWREIASAYIGWRMLVDEFRELDQERVLVLVRNAGRGKASGIDVRDVSPRLAHLFYLRDRKVSRFVVYFDRARALADLGQMHEADR